MKLLESVVFALIVAGVIGFVTWRSGGDWQLAVPLSFLVAFVAAYMKVRTTSTRRTVRRR